MRSPPDNAEITTRIYFVIWNDKYVFHGTLVIHHEVGEIQWLHVILAAVNDHIGCLGSFAPMIAGIVIVGIQVHLGQDSVRHPFVHFCISSRFILSQIRNGCK